MKKHSEFNGFPIELYVEKSKEKEVTDSDEEDMVVSLSGMPSHLMIKQSEREQEQNSNNNDVFVLETDQF